MKAYVFASLFSLFGALHRLRPGPVHSPARRRSGTGRCPGRRTRRVTKFYSLGDTRTHKGKVRADAFIPVMKQREH